MARSRFGWITYFFFLFILFLAAVVIFGLVKDGEIPKPNSDPEKERFQFVALFLIVVLLGWVFAKYVSIVTITASGIVIRTLLKRRIIDKGSITSIDLLSKAGSYTNAASAIRISLANAKDIVITGVYFNNTHQLRQALNDYFKEKIKDYSIPRPPKSRTQWNAEKFTGNFHSSGNGIIFYILSGGFIAAALVTREAGLIFTACIMVTVMFIHAAIQSYYFEITGQDFVVRNQLLPWIDKKYALDDILVIEFEKPQKRSNAVVIYLHDFRRKEYSAGSLRSKRWTAMKDALEKAGIPVKNQLLF